MYILHVTARLLAQVVFSEYIEVLAVQSPHTSVELYGVCMASC